MRVFLLVISFAFSSSVVAESDLVEYFEGLWGWIADPELDCDTNPHRFVFDADLAGFELHFVNVIEHPPGTETRNIRYDILDWAENVLSVVLEDEYRMDENGETVTWDLVFSKQGGAYCWRRNDWPEGSCTPELKRCKGPSQMQAQLTPNKSQQEGG